MDCAVNNIKVSTHRRCLCSTLTHQHEHLCNDPINTNALELHDPFPRLHP